MQTSINFEIDVSALRASKAKSTRFTYETRFVPLRFASDTGNWFQSNWQTVRATLPTSRPAAVPAAIQPSVSGAPAAFKATGLCKLFVWLQYVFNCDVKRRGVGNRVLKMSGNGFKGAKRLAWSDQARQDEMRFCSRGIG